jgi:hypothetical protein
MAGVKHMNERMNLNLIANNVKTILNYKISVCNKRTENFQISKNDELTNPFTVLLNLHCIIIITQDCSILGGGMTSCNCAKITQIVMTFSTKSLAKTDRAIYIM